MTERATPNRLRTHGPFVAALLWFVFVSTWWGVYREFWGGWGLAILSISSAVVVFVGIAYWRPENKAPWILLGLAHTFFGIANTLLTIGVHGHQGLLDSHITDVFYLGMHPYLLASMLWFAWLRDGMRDRVALLDAAIAGIGIASFALLAGIDAYWKSSSFHIWQKAEASTYTIFFTIQLIGALRLFFSAGRRRPAFYALMISVFGLVVAEYGYSKFSSDPDGIGFRLMYDLPYTLFYILPALCAVHRSMLDVGREAPRDRSFVGVSLDRFVRLAPPWRLWFIFLTGLIPFIYMLFNVFRDESSAALRVCATVIFLLSTFRFHVVRQIFRNTVVQVVEAARERTLFQ